MLPEGLHPSSNFRSPLSFSTGAVFLLLWAFFHVPVTGASAGVDADLKKQKKELSELKQRLSREKKALEHLLEKKAAYINQIDQISENMTAVKDYVSKMETTAYTLQISLSRKQNDLDALRARIEERNRIIAGRVRSLYMAGKEDFLFMDQLPWKDMGFFKKLFFMQRLVAYDKSIIAAARQDETEKQEKLRSVQEKITEISLFKKQKSKEMKKYSGEYENLSSRMKTLKNDEASRKKALVDLEKNTAAMAGIIRALEKRRQEELTLRKKDKALDKSGQFCQPVQGKVISRYGNQYHSTLKTMTKNLGVEYLGSPGEAVKSAAPGEVVYVNDIPGYGKGVIIYNGSGIYNIYGNLDAIKVREGDKIAGCRDIAAIPKESGKSDRKIYFEVRKERDPLDPVKWLKTMIH